MEKDRGPSAKPRLASWPLLLVFLLLSLGIAITTRLDYLRQKKAEYAKQTAQLQAIADLKVSEIRRWLDERLGDAHLITKDRERTAILAAFLRGLPQAAAGAGSIRGWMAALRDTYHYENIFLLDEQGRIALAASPHHAALDAEGRAMLAVARERREAVLSDLHSDPQMPHPHMGVIAPLLTADGIVGFVLLRIDPGRFLFPLIQSWPTPSPTAETLLVRRDGRDVLFLNELRHRQGTALKLRLPLATADLPAAQAVKGKTGVLRGRDYRGVPVWTAVQPVPGTRWFMVAKVDEAEILTPLGRRSRQNALLALALILATGALVLMLWRGQTYRFHLRQLEAKSERQALVKHFDYLSRYANDLILLSDGDHNIIEANERAVQAYGYGREELLAMNIRQLRVPGEREALDGHYLQAREHDGIIFETVHQHRDGSAFPVEVSARIIHIDDKEYFQSIYRDISERKEAEARLRHANRLYAVLSQVNQAIVRAKGRERLFQDICDVAVRFGEFRLARIDLADDEGGVTRTAFRASGGGVPPDLLLDPAVVAVREGSVAVCNDVAAGADPPARRDEALRNGILSTAALPIRFRAATIGALHLYAGERGFFDADIMGLLQEIAGDIAYALDALATEQERRTAESTLAESEQKYRLIAENASDWIYWIAPDGSWRYASPSCEKMTGYAAEEFIADPGLIGKIALPEEREFLRSHLEQALADREPDHMEFRIRARDGREIWIDHRCAPIHSPDGHYAGRLGTNHDISERKQAEETARLAQERIRQFIDANIVGVVIASPSGEIIETNDYYLNLIGYTRKEYEQGMVNWREITPPEWLAADERAIQELRKTGRCTPYEKEYIRRDGMRVAVFLVDAMLPGPEEQIAAFALDLSKHKQAEESLRESEVKYRHMFANNPQPMWIYDLETLAFLEVNGAAIQHYGYTRKEFLAMTLKDIRPAEDIPALLKDVEQTRRVLNPAGEWRHRKKNGEIIQVEIVSHSVVFNGRQARHVLVNDISERKRAEMALLESEQKFKSSFAAANVGKSITLPTGEINFNQAFCDMLGYSPDELSGKTWQQLTPAGDVAAVQKILDPLLQGEEAAARFTKRYIHKDGSLVWGDVSVAIRRDAEGKPLHFITTVVDISERRQAEEKLLEKHALLRIAGEMARLGGWNVNLEENRCYWSDEVAAIHEMPPGYSPLVEEGISFYAPEWRERITEVFSACAQKGIPYNEEMEILTAKGKRIWVQTIGEAVRDDTGKIIKVQGAFQDISERKQAERNLQRLSERNQALLDAIPDIIMEVDENKVYTWANHAGIEFFGIDVIGTEAAAYFWGEQNTYKTVQPLFNGEERIIYLESWQRRRDGEKRLLAWWCRVLKDSDGNVSGALSSARDITEFKLAEEEIRLLNAELEQRVAQRTAQLQAANKELEAFSYSVSHDLRAPLRAIDGFARIVLEEYAPRLDDEGRRLLGVIGGNTQKMGRLIDDLLAFSRLSRQAMVSSSFDPAPLAEEVFAELRAQEGRRSIQLKLSAAPPALGDRAMLRLVLGNLLSNAVKFTRGRKQARIEFGGRAEEDGNVYFVRDNGVGFDPEYGHKLFGVFQRLHSSSEFEGTGVGLAIVQRIVARHGGRVWAEGRPGKGASFYFFLPREGGEHEPRERS
ncbi:MAG: PAS domain S-box protein [Acidobacteria bacterium]|jgi:PAS domain S-box-containing protein|nr:PAS domain S-box protein [Acidobacteriota bacterium]